MAFAIVDEHGTVWGTGETEAEAQTDAVRWLSELTEVERAATTLDCREISMGQAERISNGTVAWADLATEAAR